MNVTFHGAAREVTVECNPESLTPEKARLLRELGCDRLSIGVQSLEPALLELFGRAHTAEMAFAAYDAASGDVKRPTTLSSELAALRPQGILGRSHVIVIGIIPIGHPLTHIAAHIVGAHRAHISWKVGPVDGHRPAIPRINVVGQRRVWKCLTPRIREGLTCLRVPASGLRPAVP